MSTSSAAGFVRRLAETRVGSTFNFHAEGAGAEMRRARPGAFAFRAGLIELLDA